MLCHLWPKKVASGYEISVIVLNRTDKNNQTNMIS